MKRSMSGPPTKKATKRRCSVPLLNPVRQKKRALQEISDDHRSPEDTTNPATPTASGSQGTRDVESIEQSQLHQPGPDEVSRLLPGDRNALKMIVSGAEKRIINYVTMTHRKLLSDIKTNENSITDLAKAVRALDGTVSSMKVLTLHNSATTHRSRSNGSVGVKGSNNGKKSALQQEIEEKFPSISVEISAVFHSDLFSRAAAHSICSYMDALHKVQDDHAVTARTLSVFMYGLQRGQLMKEYKYGLGKQHANFRFKAVLSATRQALELTEQSFVEQQKQVIADLVRDGKISPGEIVPSAHKPSWLSARVLTKEIMMDARKFHECLKAEHSPLPKSMNSRLALHVGRFAVKSIMDMLRLSRDRCKAKLFAAGFFLFIDWTKMNCFKPGHTLPEVMFVSPSAIPAQPADIPYCATVSEEQYDITNDRILKDLIKSSDAMTIEATYIVTVMISKAPPMSGADDVTELKQMRRHFNILRMASVFLTSYTHIREDVLLASHPSMLRNIYRLALVLREFFIDHVEESYRPPRAKLATDVDRTETNEARSTGHNGRTPETEGASRSENGTLGRSEHLGNVRSGNGRENNTGNSAIPPVQLKHMITNHDHEVKTIMGKVLEVSVELYNKLNVPEQEDEMEEGGHGKDEGRENNETEEAVGSHCLDSDEEDMTGMLDM